MGIISAHTMQNTPGMYVWNQSSAALLPKAQFSMLTSKWSSSWVCSLLAIFEGISHSGVVLTSRVTKTAPWQKKLRGPSLARAKMWLGAALTLQGALNLALHVALDMVLEVILEATLATVRQSVGFRENFVCKVSPRAFGQ